MSEAKKLNEGVVTSLPDTSYVVACDADGNLSPIKVSALFGAIRDSIKVGGRNLIKDSDTPHSGAYGIGNLKLAEPWKSDRQYILTLEGVVIGAGYQDYIQVWNEGGSRHLFSCYSTDVDGVYRGIFDTQGLSEDKNNAFSIHNFPNGLSTITSFTRAKFEEGNIPTAWSPAPEDVLSNSGGG